MDDILFSIQKEVSFSKIKEIKALRGGVLMYAAQEKLKIDAEIGTKGLFLDGNNLATPGA